MEATEDIPSCRKIAIVGIGCRFAGGADTVEKLWELLEEGKDCSSPHPDNRYDVSYFVSPGEKLPGKMNNLRGSYLEQDPYKFDRNFFKMPPDEAQHMDPAIRILLEVSWEALEDAGISASAQRGSHTGVYIGGMSISEYRSLLSKPDDNIGQYTNSGNTSCMLANRISYEFDFRGPSIALDTACSSSLSAIYLACEALKNNQCPMALAGGVNMMLMPQVMIGLCQAGMVSPDGRSKSFDVSADGYGRGEGFGVVVLKTLEKALADEDRIYAVLRGGAMSNDGRTKGIISPSADAQRKLLEAVCLNAKVEPRNVTYTEAHGTGTALGDKTEATVLGEFFGQCRSSEQPPLLIGSIKSNIGHTESAAGVAGVIKASLCLKHQLIPKVVHFNSPNPDLDLNQLNLRVPKSTIPWPPGEPRIASCSSFGFGGSNACMILEAAPNSKMTTNTIPTCFTETEKAKPTVLVLSASSKEALQQRLRDWLVFLQRSDIKDSQTNFKAALFTAAQRSHHHQYRLCFIINTVEDAIDLIQSKLDGGDVKTRTIEGISRTANTATQMTFVFSGMGTQWWGMARDLMKTEPIFSTMIKRISKLLKTCGTKWSLVNMLTNEDNTEKINETEIAQPCICAVQIALVELWRSRGIVPDVVVGHSVGEVAAAYCAGLLSLEQTISLIYHRGRQLRKTSGSGSMMAVLHPVDEVLQEMRSKGYEQILDIAAINSPSQVVISGATDSINDLMTKFKSDNIRCVQLKVRNAFHSRQQACLEKIFKSKVSKFLKTRNGTAVNVELVPMLSTVTGRYLTREEATSAEYWWSNIRQQVCFKTAVETLANDGFHVFLDIGSHPALTPAIRDTMSNFGRLSVKPITAGSLVRPRDTSKTADDRVTLLCNHAQMFVSGVQVNFGSYFDGDSTTVISIPKYPWQRELCTAVTSDTSKEYQFPAQNYPLLGEEQVLYTNTVSVNAMKWWKSFFTKCTVPWLKDHRIGGAIIFPAAGYIEVSLAVAKAQLPEMSPITLRDVDLQKFMFLPEGEGSLETTAEQVTASEVHVTIRSCSSDKTWIRHMETDIVTQSSTQQDNFLDTDSLAKRCNVPVTQTMMSEIFERAGLTFGPSFQTTTRAFINEACTEVIGYAEAPDVILREFGRYAFHPALLDGCFQLNAFPVTFKQEMEAEKRGTLVQSSKQVPRKMKSFTLFRNAPKSIFVHSTLYKDDHETDISYCDMTIADADSNEIVAKVERLEFAKFEANAELGPHVWTTNWINVPSSEQKMEHRSCLIIPDRLGISNEVEAHLQASGVSTLVSNVVVNKSHDIGQYFDQSHSFTDILVLQPLNMVNLQSVTTTDCMQLDEFRRIQEQFPMFCRSLILEIIDIAPNIWPRVIFVTGGAHKVVPDDNVNPFMSHIQSLLMTFMYEEPRLRALSVDVPIEVDVAETSLVIHEAFLNLPDDENVMAYREKSLSVESTKLSRFVPRLCFEPGSTYRINAENQSWAIQQTGGAARLFLKRKMTQVPPTPASKTDILNLHAVCIVPVDESFTHEKKHNSPQTNDLFTLYTGLKHSRVYKDSPHPIIGISNRRPLLSSTMHLEPSKCHYVKVPGGIECVDAIHAVKEYIPAQIFFEDIFQLSTSAHILYLTNSETSAQFHSFPVMAYAKGARLTVVNVGKDGEAENGMIGIRQNGHCKILNIDHVNNIEQVSVDLLIVPMSSTSLQKEVSTLLPTLKKSSTALFLYDGNIRQTNIMPGMAGMKIMTYSTSLPKALYGHNLDQLLANISDICGVMGTSKWLMNSLDTLVTVPLSRLPLLKGTVPQYTIISLKEEQTNLPFELHDDLWFAEKDESYLVTGGTSGFGLSVVKWLVSRGAYHIAVISRQTPRDEALKYFAEEKAAHIQHYKADVSSASDMEHVLTTIRDSKSPPLAGIFHLATQYRDGFLQQTTQERWNTVMEGKAYGALLLHQLTLKFKMPLKYFVVSSSIVSLIGNAGQSNYCAANNFLNNLCLMRRHQGLPATSVCIGFINSVGYAVSNKLVKIGEERGMMSLTPAEVLKAFNVALTTQMPLIGIGGPLILKRFVQKARVFIAHHFSESSGRFSLFKDLLADMKEVIDQPSGSFRQMLLGKTEEEATTLIEEQLIQILSTQLGTQENIDTDATLFSLGLDSLLATSVSEAIVDHFEVTISPVELINDSMTTRRLQVQIFNSIKMTPTNAGTSDVIDDNASRIKEVNSNTKPWIVDGPTYSNETPSLTMVCFPPTGGGISFFSSWSSHVMKFGIQLVFVQLPGWEGREAEKTVNSWQEIVEKVTTELIHRLVDRKFVLFGHSMGSLLAFETAHKLQASNLRPLHMFVSAWYAPTLPYPYPDELENPRFAELKQVLETGEDFLKYVSGEDRMNLSFLDDTFLNNRIMLLRLVPAIEEAYIIVKGYQCENRDQLSCGMTVFGGKNDPFISPRLLGDWKRQVSASHRFKKVMYEGEHMFILSKVGAVVREIALALQKYADKKKK